MWQIVQIDVIAIKYSKIQRITAVINVEDVYYEFNMQVYLGLCRS